MKNEGVKYLVSLVALLLASVSLATACSYATYTPIVPPPKPQVTPHVTQPPIVTENQSAAETPPANPPTAEEQWYPVTNFSGTLNQTTQAFHIYGTEWHLTWTIDAPDLETAVLKLAIYPKEEPYALWQTVSNTGGSTGTANYFVSNPNQRDLFIKVTAQNLRQWTISVEDNGTAATSYPVQIYSIHFKGTVFLPDPKATCCTHERVEPDEYVVIKNLSTCFQDMTGWTLKNISQLSPTFKFPPFIISPGEIIRIYTDELHPETGGFSFNYGYGNIWNNDSPNIGVLYDAHGNEVSRKSYTLPMKLNEPAK